MITLAMTREQAIMVWECLDWDNRQHPSEEIADLLKTLKTAIKQSPSECPVPPTDGNDAGDSGSGEGADAEPKDWVRKCPKCDLPLRKQYTCINCHETFGSKSIEDAGVTLEKEGN